MIFITTLFNAFATDLEFNSNPMVAVGVRSGANSDINSNPSAYVSLKMSTLVYKTDHPIKFLVPGIGVQSSGGKSYINLSLAPVVFEGSYGYGFGIDLFTSTKGANGGRGNYGFFIEKSF
jgi:hypothetical protein